MRRPLVAVSETDDDFAGDALHGVGTAVAAEGEGRGEIGGEVGVGGEGDLLEEL